MYKGKFIESERNWGQDIWINEYETEEEALKVVEETNAENTSITAPDYYIMA